MLHLSCCPAVTFPHGTAQLSLYHATLPFFLSPAAPFLLSTYLQEVGSQCSEDVPGLAGGQRRLQMGLLESGTDPLQVREQGEHRVGRG